MKIIKSKIISLNRNDIDTDTIIPGQFLATEGKTDFKEALFSGLRQIEPDCPFNFPEYENAEILISGENFGCGSSREHAVWAIKSWGIKVVIAESFSDIFYNNALKNGLCVISLDKEKIKKIFEDNENNSNFSLEINLPDQKINFSDGNFIEFDIDQYRKECLIKEIDDMDYLLKHIKEIKSYDIKQQEKKFFDISKIQL